MSRQECLVILAYHISKQTFLSKITQWVLVSADRSWSQEGFNKVVQNIRTMFPELHSIKIECIYITHDVAKEKQWEVCTHPEEYEAIGYLRNISNSVATGEYIVCMDDDDYYPPQRVEHAVVSLRRSHKLLAGCSNHIMYDSDLESVYQFKRFGQNHSVNNALAYKRKYIEDGAKYDSTKRHAEEKSFLNDYKNEMIQLDPSKTIVQMVHDSNTYNKRQLVVHDILE